MSFFKDYFELINQALQSELNESFEKAAALIVETHKKGGKIIVAGNGGSAAMASHVMVDFTKAAKIRAVAFNDADLITCFANDYGYENWVVEGLKAYADPNDAVILISSSGTSKNIVNAAQYTKKTGISLITFSGFASDNPLCSLGNVNFWVDSKGYNIIEMTHHVWLVAIIDFIIGKIEYSA